MPGVAEIEPEARQEKPEMEVEAEMAPAVADSDKKKKKKRKAEDAVDDSVQDGNAEERAGKKKKKKSSEDVTNGGDGGIVEKARKKKKKSSEDFPDSSEAVDVQEVSKKKKKNADDVPSSSDTDTENPYALSNFRISDAVKAALKVKGITALFPIQAQTFDIVMDGEDLVARARTGQGKTLAFVLPIVESLSKSSGQQQKYGRPPRVLVLAPTRELAKQVHEDFECYGKAVGLSTICVYGGSQYGPQQNAMRRGVDIVVGTPGRIQDFLDRGDLNLKTLKFRVLDEADEMLNMGFVEAVEYILGAVEDTNSVQTLLFSATMPHWVKEIANKFFKANKKTVDLVGDDKMKASKSVRHLLLPCVYTARAQILLDVIKVYGSGGRIIVFTETKNDASELAGALGTHVARALHGDIPQGQREVTLAGFRSGKFNVLVATDVAARGLDINDVQLIIQCEPPRDVETYIHRSGRTGRAGNSGVAIMLYDRKKEYMIPIIEGKAGFKFERITPPQPSDIAKESALGASKGVSEVSDSVVPLFKEAAQELVNTLGVPAVDILAKALAKIAGYTNVKRRSLQTSHDDSTTLLFQASRQIYSAGYIFNVLRGLVSQESVSEVRRMNLTADGMGAVFDVPNTIVDEFLTGSDSEAGYTISVAESLPELTPKPERDNYRFGGGRSNGGRGRGGFGRGGSAGGRGRWNR